MEPLEVEGIGLIDQYGTYLDKLWSHGVIYFLRDFIYNDIQALAEEGRDVRSLVARLNRLNSEISARECGPT